MDDVALVKRDLWQSKYCPKMKGDERDIDFAQCLGCVRIPIRDESKTESRLRACNPLAKNRSE